MNDFQFILEPYKGMNTRHFCPSCNHRSKTFVKYIDVETGEYTSQDTGRCNREMKCGYHYTPKQYFQNNNILLDKPQLKQDLKPKQSLTNQSTPISFIPAELFKTSLKKYESNNFVKFLIGQFGVEKTSKLISKYFIGTSKHWPGASVFWQIDISGKVRTGKIMLYDGDTGKRVKEPFNHIHWMHKSLRMPEFELKQCLFGEHLLKDKSKPVAIVESEKTAIIASEYLPQFIWLASGSLSNLNPEKCAILNGRNIILFPDLNGFEKWKSKMTELSARLIGTKLSISDLLERKATESERKKGLDLADYLVRFSLSSFQDSLEKLEFFIKDGQNWQVKISEFGYPIEWDS